MTALRNDSNTYGLVARVLHWGMGLAILAMFAMGVYMRQLTYYDPLYQVLPNIHRSTGIILMVLLVARLIWKVANPTPSDDHLKPVERKISTLVHWVFYGLLLAIMVAGYLISTSDGRPISVFGLFEVPSLYKDTSITKTVGWLHEYMSYALIGLVVLHAAAAIKHHVIDKDVTLIRMWSGKSQRKDAPSDAAPAE